ncbi:hypothetical protein B0H11DRAFT_2368345 [Mycena galericulata]|nr:hypothetical protein B0H11DRAFT_2368345 [Mycena galericulata]
MYPDSERNSHLRRELHTSGRPLCAARIQRAPLHFFQLDSQTPGPQSLSAAEYQLTNSATLVHVLQFSDAILRHISILPSPLLCEMFRSRSAAAFQSRDLESIFELWSCGHEPSHIARGIVRPLGQLLREVVSQLAIPPGKAALLLLAVRGDPGDETDFNSTQCAPIVHITRPRLKLALRVSRADPFLLLFGARREFLAESPRGNGRPMNPWAPPMGTGTRTCTRTRTCTTSAALRAVPAHPHSSPTSTTKLSTSTKLPPVLPTPTSPAPASKLPRFLQSPSSATAPSPSPSTARPPPRLPPPRTPPPPPPTRSPAESANASTAPHWCYTCTPPACLAPGVAPVPICELTRPRKGYDSTPNQTSATLRRYPQREAALGVERCSAIDAVCRSLSLMRANDPCARGANALTKSCVSWRSAWLDDEMGGARRRIFNRGEGLSAPPSIGGAGVGTDADAPRERGLRWICRLRTIPTPGPPPGDANALAKNCVRVALYRWRRRRDGRGAPSRRTRTLRNDDAATARACR